MRFVRALVAFAPFWGVGRAAAAWWDRTSDTQWRGRCCSVCRSRCSGLAILFWRALTLCRRQGTLALWIRRRVLVVVGLYRYVRNPMYVGVLTLVLGWSIAAGLAQPGALLVPCSPSGFTCARSSMKTRCGALRAGLRTLLRHRAALDPRRALVLSARAALPRQLPDSHVMRRRGAPPVGAVRRRAVNVLPHLRFRARRKHGADGARPPAGTAGHTN